MPPPDFSRVRAPSRRPSVANLEGMLSQPAPPASSTTVPFWMLVLVALVRSV
jgi:hypothetical protein